MTEFEALLTLTSTRGIGSVRYERLLNHFHSLENISQAKESDLAQVKGIGPELAKEIKTAYQEDRGKKELALAQKSRVKIITYQDEAYPENLRTIYDYSLVLYVKGELKPEDDLAMAVVGSRRASYYGKNQSERLSYALAQRGICVVSGLARGIDSQAHLGALKAKGRTIAVLGNGLNRIYPSENKKLAEQIAINGALVSELPMETPPDSRNFPARNRIISGLSLGVLVVEAPLRSGALITVDLALDQGREIFAMPGKIDSPVSQGCHRLIKQGAKLVEDVDDIIEELNYYQVRLKLAPEEKRVASPLSALNHREEAIVNLLSQDEPKNIEEIILESKLPPALVSSTLLMLELKKYVKQLPGSNFLRAI